ncbi:hypothetical protein RB595_007647 [Gaeumannomyces hyphopodioides]
MAGPIKTMGTPNTATRFHGNRGPNDSTQNEALDIAHHIMCLALDNKLFLAPVDNPQRLLDVGTGTGIWAIDFADEHPSAEVIGTDLSPIQPSWVPPNCKFKLDNAENEWTYADNSFDYIHFEHHKFSILLLSDNGSVPPNSVWVDWYNLFREAGSKTGRSFVVTEIWENALRAAGFTGNIHRAIFKLPMGGWAADPKWKEVGIFNRISIEQGLDGFASYIRRMVMDWREKEYHVLLAKVRNAIRNRGWHAYYPLKVIYIQKPL